MTYEKAMIEVSKGNRVKYGAIEVFLGDGDFGPPGEPAIRRVKSGTVIIEAYKPLREEQESKDWELAV